MCCSAPIVVADEPTGNLDEQNTQEIIHLFQELAHQQQKCVILVTHEKKSQQVVMFSIIFKIKPFSQLYPK